MYDKGKMILNVFTGLHVMLGENYDIQILYPEKNNGQKRTAISLHKKNTRLGKVIYLDEFLEAEKGTYEIIEAVTDILENEDIPFDEDIADKVEWKLFGAVKDMVRMRLVNYEANKMDLKTVPHVRFLDLAVVFYLTLYMSDEGIASAKIEQQNLDLWEISTETLYQTAMDNMRKYEPVEIESMASKMRKIWLKDTGREEDDGVFEIIFSAEKKLYPLYVLTNKRDCYGAAGILYGTELNALAEHYQNNIIIIPSSIHECLLLPDIGKMSYKDVQHMIMEVNGNEVKPEERLSNSVYLYDRTANCIRIALQGTGVV